MYIHLLPRHTPIYCIRNHYKNTKSETKQQEKEKEGRNEECQETAGPFFFIPRTNLAFHIGDMPRLILTRTYEEPFAPPAENVELQLPSTEAVIRWYRHTLDAPRYKSLIFTRRWRWQGCVRGSRCYGANKYRPIARRVREEEKKKGSPGGLTSVGRSARLALAACIGQ